MALSPSLYAQAESPPAKALQAVEVTGNSDDIKPEGPAIAQIIGQAELNRYGDPSVLEVLRRQPGIVVLNGPGGVGQLRMRGLGGAYVRILVDGEPAPANFTLDTLAPALVEHIVMTPVSSVELGSQGIAGTINIILKRTRSKLQRQAAVVLHRNVGYWTPQATGTYGDSDGRFAWLATGSARMRKGDDRYDSTLEEQDPLGSGSALRVIEQLNHDDSVSWNVAPRLTWTSADGASV